MGTFQEISSQPFLSERFRRFAFLAGVVAQTGGLLVSVTLFGCSPVQETHAKEPAYGRNAISARPVPASLKRRYQEAKRRFAAHDYTGALAQIDLALATPDLTDRERTFLREQQTLCQAALTGKPIEAPVATTTPRPAIRPTSDCGPRALLLVCRKRGILKTPSLARLCQVAGTGKEGTTLTGLQKAAQAVGLYAKGVQMDGNALAQLDKPAIAWVDGNHYIAVLSVQSTLTGETQATVHDPNQDREQVISTATLLQRCGGVLLVLEPAHPRNTAHKEEPQTAS